MYEKDVGVEPTIPRSPPERSNQMHQGGQSI